MNESSQSSRNAPGARAAWSLSLQRSVRARLLRLAMSTTMIALGVAGAAMLAVDLNRYKSNSAADLTTEAAMLSVAIAPALAFNDHETAMRDLEAFRARPRVSAAAVYGVDGRVYASFLRENSQPLPTAAPPEGLRMSGERVELTRRIERNGEVLGVIYLRGRYDLFGRLEDYLKIFGLVTLLSVAVAFLLSRKLRRGISEPLDAMAAIAQTVVSKKDYSLRAMKTADDDIGVVVDAFNNMLEEVETRSEALEESNRALTEEVQVRQKAQEALKAADRRKDEFLATLAHEMRNPLAPIRHAVKVLESKDLESAQYTWARDIIGRQVRRMALLLDDLLDISRITQGRLDLKIETVTLSSLVEAALETARPLLDSKRHALTVELPAQPVLLSVDPLRISQALSNLLTNAAKYTDVGGRIVVSAEVLTAEVRMSVKDDGIGVEAEALPGLFEMFSQVNSAIARSEGGLGIGLALVKGLVGLHQGWVELRSEGRGLGSEFIIHLPRSVLAAALEPQTEQGMPAAAAGAIRHRIVVADDNRDAADSLGMLLELSGHKVSVCYSGEAALKLARKTLVNVMILDIGMPDLTGYEVARRVRAERWGTDVFLIAVTGWGQTEDKSRAIAAGFDHHLTKPVDPTDVEVILQTAAGSRRAIDG
jgi:signal transduction histidine kinase/ActR/RegA family two-component response regulator